MTVVTLTKTGNIGVIEIDNPPVNALNRPVRSGLLDCVSSANDDPQIEAVVIKGGGRGFSAGADIREFSQPPSAPSLPDVVHGIEASAKPVVAAIHGNALGGGLELAMGCHYRVAGEGSRLGLPEVNLGLLPGATGTQRLPRLTGSEAALEIMLGGKPLEADRAKSLGLVDSVVSDETLVDAAMACAREHIGKPPRRLREATVAAAPDELFAATRRAIAKKTRGLMSPEKIIQCVEAATRLDYEAGCRFERQAFLECKASPQSDGLRHAFFAEREAGRVPGIGRHTATRPVGSIAVLGAGTMGAGIAYAALSAGFRVHLLDKDDAGLAHGRRTIESLFDHGIGRGKFDRGTATERLGMFTTSTRLDDVADADLVIEAVFEKMAVKRDVFAKLDAVCKPGAILATNTSTLDVDRIADATRRPEDVIGLHFFSPAHIMRLLEIVRGKRTADEVIATSLAVSRRLGKIGVVVGNCFGFVGNRMLYSYGRENQLLLLEGAAPDTIDRTLYDWGMAMGPNAVGDLAGLDVGYKVRQERDDLPDDPRYYRVADLLVERGRYGQKTGKGMFLYDADSRSPIPDPEVQRMIRDEAERLGIRQRDVPADEIIDRCIMGLISEGARLLEEGIAARAGDIDVIWVNGYGFPRYRGGPMHYADRIGLDRVCAKIAEFADRYGSRYWEPPPLLAELARSGGSFGAWRRT
jgi:3-hydroxyacyl-CoA dehydrogenase